MKKSTVWVSLKDTMEFTTDLRWKKNVESLHRRYAYASTPLQCPNLLVVLTNNIIIRKYLDDCSLGIHLLLLLVYFMATREFWIRLKYYIYMSQLNFSRGVFIGGSFL